VFNAKIGELLARITPPEGTSIGYCQSGKVVEVTDTEIVLEVQVDILRRMRFDRKNGLDTVGLGSFIVRPDVLPSDQLDGSS
jgi:hypothetical protein